MTADIINFEDRVIDKHVKEALHAYRMQGKAALGIRMEEVPFIYKKRVAIKLKGLLNNNNEDT